MTYGHTGSNRVDPKSLGATLLVNGAFLAMVVTIGTGIVATPRTPSTPIDVHNIPVAPPKILDIPEDKIKPEDKINPINDPGTPEVDRSTRTASTPDTYGGPAPDPFVDTGSGSALPAPEPDVDLPPPPPDPIPEIKAKPIFRAAINDPRYASAFLPPYLRGLQTEGVEGAVTVKVKIGTDGRVKEIILLAATEDDFWTATQKHALNKWRFKPATEDSIPVESWREMTVRFRIDRE